MVVLGMYSPILVVMLLCNSSRRSSTILRVGLRRHVDILGLIIVTPAICMLGLARALLNPQRREIQGEWIGEDHGGSQRTDERTAGIAQDLAIYSEVPEIEY